MVQCTAITTKGKQCLKEGIRDSELCEWHHPNTSRCGAVTKSGGSCKILLGKCKYHTPQNGRGVENPLGTDSTIFRRVGLLHETEGLVKEYRCESHHPETPKCGAKTRSGGFCKILLAKCKYHTPQNGRGAENPLGTDPIIFRQVGLRREKGGLVKEYRSGRDAYTRRELFRNSADDEMVMALRMSDDPLRLELDHIVEIHVVRDCYDGIRKTGTGFAKRKDDLKATLRNSIVNEVSNLNFTTQSINQSKFRATDDFQRAYRCRGNNVDDGQGLFEHLLGHLQQDGSGFDRRTTARIQAELYDSWKAMEEKLEEEQPLQGEFMEHLHRNMVAMKLT